MTTRRLGLLLAALFVALALPSGILVYHAYGQLKWEAFHQHQRLASELTRRIDAGFRQLIEREEKRPISDYEFLNVTGSEGTGFLQRSPLSNFPPRSDLPGLLGYFQVDAEGRLRTPIVPDAGAGSYGISAAELQQRRAQESRIRGILDQNRLVGKDDAPLATVAEEAVLERERAASPESQDEDFSDSPRPLAKMQQLGESVSRDNREAEGQAAFDELTSRSQVLPAESSVAVEQVSDLKLTDRYRVASEVPEPEPVDAQKKSEVKRSRKEKVNLPQTVTSEVHIPPQPQRELDLAIAAAPVPSPRPIRIQTFESEVEALELALLDSGHFVLFRRVWHQDGRYVQGILLDQARFIEALVEPAFRQSTLSSMSRLIVAYRGGILRDFDADYSRLYQPSTADAGDELLYQSRLMAPFGDIELVYALARLPLGAGSRIIIWSALVLTLVLIGGFFLLYQLGLRQLALARQQQDFVSAVSHELKTPLTSIRMYGEMLREGWADENKRRSYYDFIYHEAERLTRLINNVLQLARLSRNEQQASLSFVPVAELLAELRPRLESQLEPSGFRLNLETDDSLDSIRINVDPDWFIQIMINLVDNAVKFSAGADRHEVDFRARQLQDGRIQFSVRDYGPGIAADQMKKIFKLFYRSENELTRETVGTGIGLSLVQQLTSAMGAEIDVVNSDPGAEFRIRFKTD